MQRLLNLLRGTVRVEVVCRYPERFVNLCAANAIAFWGMQQLETGELRAFFSAADFRLLRSLSAANGFEVSRISRRGAPMVLRRLRGRQLLVAGLVFVVIATRVTSLFVWDIRVIGNEAVPRAVIMQALREFGFTYGTFGYGIESEMLAEKMKLRLPELAWFAVNISGSRADVLVRERVPAPEIIDRSVPAMVVATKSGIITKLNVLEGRALVSVGATVERGDVLVTGMLDSRTNGPREVHALAEIEARTWYEISACMPVETTVKRFLGEKRVKNTLIFGGKRINFYFNSGISWSNYDKIITETPLRLPMGVSLPIKLVRETYKRYEPVTTEQSRERVIDTLKQQLTERLSDAIGDGSINAIAWDAREDNGVITVTMYAECVEQIAASRSFTIWEGNLSATQP